jgi:hypothetical protein
MTAAYLPSVSTETFFHTEQLSIKNVDQVKRIQVRVSHYTPWTGGTNCSNFSNGSCISRMASGLRWQDWSDRGAACVSSWSFGTRFKLPDGRVFECQDRGSAIVTGADGLPWVDLLTSSPGYSFGQVVVSRMWGILH